MITYQIVAALAALLALVLRTLLPGFPLDQTQILSLLVFVLGLGGIVVQAPFRKLQFKGTDGWLKSKAFWLGLAGLLNLVIHAYAPDFPLLAADLGALILWILGLAGITPEIRELKARLAKK